MRTVAQMDATTFAAVLDHVDASTARAWCVAHPDEALPTGLLQRLIGHGDAHLTAHLARRAMPAEQVEELLKDRRVAVAEALLDRDDLTATQLRRLLQRDSPNISAKVWRHAACTDELRRLILTGITMNPRARDKDRTVSTPDLDLDDIPERLRPALAETASPSLYHLHLRTVTRELSDPVRLHVELGRAFRLASRAYGRRGAWSPWVAIQPLERLVKEATHGDDPELAALAKKLSLLAKSPKDGKLEQGLAVHAGWTERSTAGTDVGAALRRGDARAADLESLTRDDVAALADVALPERSVRMLLRHRPELAPDAWWDDALEALDGVSAPVAVLDRWVRDGRVLAVSRGSRGGFGTAGRHLLSGGTAAHVAALVTPATAAPLLAPDQAALAAWLTDRLGADETSWATFAELLDGFDGTLAQLTDTVVALRPAA